MLTPAHKDGKIKKIRVLGLWQKDEEEEEDNNSSSAHNTELIEKKSSCY
jgi:hypothetical protein